MIKLVSSIMKKMIEYSEGDIRRINHALKVYSYAWSIGELEGMEGEALEILEVASLLHDIGIKESERKYSSSDGKYQELEGPPIALGFLEEYGLAGSFTDRVCFLIGNHHSYANIDGLDFQALVEADFLVNIDEGWVEKKSIGAVKSKYFKTGTGLGYLESMFGKG
jgi:HD superfamily phosphodiesterase